MYRLLLISDLLSFFSYSYHRLPKAQQVAGLVGIARLTEAAVTAQVDQRCRLTFIDEQDIIHKKHVICNVEGGLL